MNMKEVTVVNIDNYIFQERKKGVFEIKWDKNGWEILKLFKPQIKSGDQYLGVIHYD